MLESTSAVPKWQVSDEESKKKITPGMKRQRVGRRVHDSCVQRLCVQTKFAGRGNLFLPRVWVREVLGLTACARSVPHAAGGKKAGKGGEW